MITQRDEAVGMVPQRALWEAEADRRVLLAELRRLQAERPAAPPVGQTVEEFARTLLDFVGRDQRTLEIEQSFRDAITARDASIAAAAAERERIIVLVSNTDGGDAWLCASLDEAKRSILAYVTDPDNHPQATANEIAEAEREIAELSLDHGVDSMHGSDAWKEWIYVARSRWLLPMTPPRPEPSASEMVAAVAKAMCGDDHLRCSYPDCSCKIIPARLPSVIAAVLDHLPRDAMRKACYLASPSRCGLDDDEIDEMLDAATAAARDAIR